MRGPSFINASVVEVTFQVTLRITKRDERATPELSMVIWEFRSLEYQAGMILQHSLLS
jgi:hypothetical protein